MPAVTALVRPTLKPAHKLRSRVDVEPTTKERTVIIKDVPPSLADITILSTYPECQHIKWCGLVREHQVGYLTFETSQAAAKAVGDSNSLTLEGKSYPAMVQVIGGAEGCIYCMNREHHAAMRCPIRIKRSVWVNDGPYATDVQIQAACGPVVEVHRKKVNRGRVEYLVLPTPAQAKALLAKKTIVLGGKVFTLAPKNSPS
eukprot:NODE_4900_length_725_cov_45.841137_g4737_i0.p1 GENE.NODE_4900_length_725_cov_45.841137_g4737_i0~~NODE_4900_length_725_cov_45.841137_g4737_i0.p1  ORF type:complete len:221 (+),score=41.36 NODE_4900_length_725_cov_45.841137_g4737_i0:62-664(+)